MTIATRPDHFGDAVSHTFHDAQTALAYMRDHPCYEIVPDELLRPYGDIDYKVPAETTREEFDALDRAVRDALTSRVHEQYRMALFSASSYEYRKISWRWTLPDGFVKSRDHARYFAQTMYEDLQLPEGASADLSVYSKNRKMRTLWTSKAGEKRPFRMVQGEEIDHLISYIPETAHFYDFPLPERTSPGKKGEGEAKPTFTCPDQSFLKSVCDCISVKDWTDYKSCQALIFTLLALGASGDFIHYYCAKAPNYGMDWVNSYITRYDPAKNRHSIGTLWFYAKQGNPQVAATLRQDTRAGRYAVEESVRLTTDAKTIFDHCDAKGFTKPLPEGATVACKAQMSTGKTTVMKKECAEAKRVVVVSCRQSFTSHICAELPGFLDYRDRKSRDEFFTVPKVVVQMQSIWRCARMEPCDLVVLDESESLLAELKPNLTHHGRYAENYKAFEKVVREAKRVIALDAFLSDRTMEMLRTLRGEATLCINPHQPFHKKAQFVSERGLYDGIRDKIQKGKRVIAVWGAREKGEAFHRTLADIPQVFHSSKSDDKTQKMLEDVNQNWQGRQLVGYTSTITVGINYTAKPFDCAALYATAWSCPARDYAQALHRGRKLVDDELLVCIQPRAPGSLIEAGLEEQEREWNARSARLKNFLNDLHLRIEDFEHVPLWLRRVLLWNFNEIVVSRLHFPEVMKHYFRECGIAYGEDAEAEGTEKVARAQCIRVEDVPDIDYETAEHYRLSRKQLSEEQQYALQKWFMNQKVERVDQTIWEAWLEDDGRKVTRCYDMRMARPEERIQDKVLELIPKDAERLAVVQGLGWNWDTAWERKIEEVPRVALDLFGIRMRSEKDTPEQYCRDLCKAFKKWCGIEMKVERKRVQEKGERTYTYKLAFDPKGQIIDYTVRPVNLTEVFTEA